VLLLGAGCGGENGSLAIHDTLMETEHEQAVLSGEVSFGDQDAIISMSWENVTTGQSGPADSIYPTGHTWTELDPGTGLFVLFFPIFIPIATGETHYEYDHHHWDATVPLTGGVNEIVVTACENSCVNQTVFVSRTLLPPEEVRADTGDGRITLLWEPILGVESHNVYWSTTPGLEISGVPVMESVLGPYTHEGLENGMTYYYRVTSKSPGCESGPSEEVAALAGAASMPSSVSTEVVDDQVVLYWDPVPGADLYNIYWSNDPGVSTSSGKKITGVSAPFHHEGLAGAVYHYVVTAENQYGESILSVEVSALVKRPPAVPTRFQADYNNLHGDTYLHWDEVATATGYNLYRCESAIDMWGNYSKCSLVFWTWAYTNRFLDDWTVKGRAYGYCVRAINEYGYSGCTATQYVKATGSYLYP